ncbi:Nse4 C-terminal-domain-containing protein [Lipomyces japonicus]|uniref:Nse4 C-terminal-domain-containing protein n=1 Tax=Lipomyces japonicus TaxID=56871 RepID=UPI0034CD21E6
MARLVQNPISPSSTVYNSDKEQVLNSSQHERLTQTETPSGDDGDGFEDQAHAEKQKGVFGELDDRLQRRLGKLVERDYFDPDQDPRERRDLRRKYRKLLKTTLESKQTLLKPRDGGLAATIQDANNLYLRVRAPNEAVLDSHLLVETGEILHRKARGIRLGSAVEFDMDDYVQRIRTFLYGDRRNHHEVNDAENNSESEDEYEEFTDADVKSWVRFGRLAHAANLAPTLNEFLSVSSEPPKVRAVTQRSAEDRTRQSKAPVVRPQDVEASNIQQQENTTSSNVMYLGMTLKSIGVPINLFEFVLNPESYSQSVENLFYLSFLVKDALVSIDENSDGVPMITYLGHIDEINQDTEQGRAEYERRRNLTRKQSVFELSMTAWRDLIDAFGIESSLIPTRQSSIQQVADANSWYG